MNDVEIKIDKNIENYTIESVVTALEIIGLKAESYAKLKCAVDTGLLRNSIAHAVSGELPGIGAEETKKHSYKSNGVDKNGNPVKKIKDKNGNEHLPDGKYELRVAQKGNEYKIYIGSNVEYAPYVEMGHIQAGTNKHIPAQPFIKPAIIEHLDEYRQILENTLKEKLR